MTTFAQPETARRLAELDALTRAAWKAYRESLVELGGRAYEEAEPGSWNRLQVSLRELDSERASLTAGTTYS